MKTLILSLSLLVGLAAGQTRPTADQFGPQAPSAGATACVWAIVGAGWQCVALDNATIYYDSTTKTLKARSSSTAPAYTEVWGEASVLSAAVTTTALKNSGAITALRVYRNGVRMSVGIDYTLSGAVITWASGQLPQQGDVVTCDYRFQ